MSRRNLRGGARTAVLQIRSLCQLGGASGFVPADRIRQDFDKFAADRFIIGSEDEVAAQIRLYGESTGTDHILLRVQWPGLGQATALRTIERLGNVIARVS